MKPLLLFLAALPLATASAQSQIDQIRERERRFQEEQVQRRQQEQRQREEEQRYREQRAREQQEEANRARMDELERRQRATENARRNEAVQRQQERQSEESSRYLEDRATERSQTAQAAIIAKERGLIAQLDQLEAARQSRALTPQEIAYLVQLHQHSVWTPPGTQQATAFQPYVSPAFAARQKLEFEASRAWLLPHVPRIIAIHNAEIAAQRGTGSNKPAETHSGSKSPAEEEFLKELTELIATQKQRHLSTTEMNWLESILAYKGDPKAPSYIKPFLDRISAFYEKERSSQATRQPSRQR